MRGGPPSQAYAAGPRASEPLQRAQSRFDRTGSTVAIAAVVAAIHGALQQALTRRRSNLCASCSDLFGRAVVSAAARSTRKAAQRMKLSDASRAGATGSRVPDDW